MEQVSQKMKRSFGSEGEGKANNFYIYSLLAASEIQQTDNLKHSSYGTVVFLPQPFTVDFGVAPWPPVHLKKDVSPRVLLISTWTDNKFGFVGGNQKKGENSCETINREFAEETGSAVIFDESDFCFSFKSERMTYVFAKVTSDEDYFNSLLINFHSVPRPAYVNEVISIAGYPIWQEGPKTLEEVSWKKNIWGLARHLCSQGGCFTPTLGNTNIPREHFILLLLKLAIVPMEEMKHIFDLASHFTTEADPNARPLPPFEDFLRTVGLSAGDEDKGVTVSVADTLS